MNIAEEHVDNTLGEIWDIDVLTDYHGRGMDHGEICLAVVTHGSAWRLASLLREADEQAEWAEEHDFLDYLLTHEPRVDSMGLDTIYYWPNVHVDFD